MTDDTNTVDVDTVLDTDVEDIIGSVGAGGEVDEPSDYTDADFDADGRLLGTGADLGQASHDVDATVLDDTNGFDLDAGEVPDKRATDTIFAELTSMAPQATAALRKEWGTDAPANLSFARATVREFADREFLDFFDDLELDGKPLSHHPVVWKFMARIGRALATEPGMPNSVRHQPLGRTNTMTHEEEAIREKLDRLHALQHSPDIREQELYKKPKTQRALEQLYRSLPGGNEPVVGTGGRVV